MELLKNLPEELQTLIILQITEKMIMAISPTPFLKEINKPKTKSEEFKEAVRSRVPDIGEEITIPQINQIQFQYPPQKPILRVSEIRLPPQFAYLRPTAVNETKLDLGKLNPLLDDPAISIIECNGPNQYLIVKGTMGTKPVPIILAKEEIDNILQAFSDESKIPLGEGVTRIALGGYELSTILSRENEPKFSIKKLPKNIPSPHRMMMHKR